MIRVECFNVMALERGSWASAGSCAKVWVLDYLKKAVPDDLDFTLVKPPSPPICVIILFLDHLLMRAGGFARFPRAFEGSCGKSHCSPIAVASWWCRTSRCHEAIA